MLLFGGGCGVAGDGAADSHPTKPKPCIIHTNNRWKTTVPHNKPAARNPYPHTDSSFLSCEECRFCFRRQIQLLSKIHLLYSYIEWTSH